MKVLGNILSFCFNFATAIVQLWLHLNNSYTMLSEYRGEEHFLLVRECLDSLELPELYSLGKNAFSLTIKNAITENSPFFYNSLI